MLNLKFFPKIFVVNRTFLEFLLGLTHWNITNIFTVIKLA